jgi:hypothetical protein
MYVYATVSILPVFLFPNTQRSLKAFTMWCHLSLHYPSIVRESNLNMLDEI